MHRAGIGRMFAVGVVAAGVRIAAAQGVFGGVVAPEPLQVAGPVGSVSGHVVAQDTQRPVRFAQVMLQSVASAGNNNEGRFGAGTGGGVSVRTDVDGSFTATNVAPGDYYVTAGAPGYAGERALLQAKVAAGADPAALLAAIPVVHVSADSNSLVNVSIERGGAISGRVVWEDGSPAAGISLSAIPAGAAATQSGRPGIAQLPALLQGIQSPGGGGSFGITDDRGAFRITGLTSGDYLVRAQVQSSTQTGGIGRTAQYVQAIGVYSPGVFRAAEAKPVSVRAGDERSDVRMTIDLRGVHMVTGHVSSTSGGQSVQFGTVSLKDMNDNSLTRTGGVDAQGNFVLRYVVPGSYVLQVAGASTEANGGSRGRGQSGTSSTSFKPFTQPLTMPDADLSGVAVMLTPVASQ